MSYGYGEGLDSLGWGGEGVARSSGGYGPAPNYKELAASLPPQLKVTAEYDVVLEEPEIGEIEISEGVSVKITEWHISMLRKGLPIDVEVPVSSTEAWKLTLRM